MARPEKVRLGEILVQQNLLTPEQLKLALDEQKRSGRKLGRVFIEQGYVTEGGRSSVFVKSGDRWLTPPVEAGLLPGVMRSIILNNPQWNAHEVDLTIDDIQNAKEIMLSNAIRGLIPAHF